MAIYQKAKKYVKKAKKAVKKRYNPKTIKGLANIASDVYLLKRALNTEKKARTIYTSTQATVGQFSSAGVEGAYYADFNIQPTQGTGGSDRVGNSIKLVSAMFQAQLSQQSATTGPVRYRWAIVCRLITASIRVPLMPLKYV